MKKVSNSWKRRLGIVAVGTVIPGLSSGPIAAQASAHPDTDYTFPFSNAPCLFEETGFSGERLTVAPLGPGQGACVDLVEHGWGGRTDSAINTSTSSNAIFHSEDCTGQLMAIPTGPAPDLSLGPNSVFVS